MERRLVAILAADVVGYTRLMGAEETETLRRFTELRQKVVEPLIAEHHGRVVKLMGDGLLVEFASVVDALTCAVAWQGGVAEREAVVDENRRLNFRIGINLGDVIVEGDDIHGDGVNIAARLEGLAEPCSITLSGDAYRQAKGKVEAAFEDMGEQHLKNVAEPVRVYRIAGDPSGRPGAAPPRAPLALPDKPSIAVLPFTNMSSDPEQEYFSDGVTEDIITELSRFRELFVIARNSSFSYKGKAAKVQDIALDLGVRYVLEGSIRAAGNRVRITAQLIDGESGHHIWSERYDREIADLFALQEEIAQTVAGTVAGKLKLTAEERAKRKPLESLRAYDYALRAQSIISDTRENNLEARRLYEKAIDLDPTLTKAYAGLALNFVIDSFNGWWEASDPPLDKALAFAAKAVALDNMDSRAQLMLGHVYDNRGECEEAKVHLSRALELNPNDADALAFMGIFLDTTHKHQEAIEHYLKAMRLNPYYPASYLWKLGGAYFNVRRYKEALIPLKEALDRNPKFKRVRMLLAGSFAQLDRIEEARAQVKILLADHPDTCIKAESHWAASHGEPGTRWLESLRKAGLPEG